MTNLSYIMLIKVSRKAGLFILSLILLISQSNITNSQGILIIDSDYVLNNVYTFDPDDSGGDIELKFGETLGEYLKWDSVDSAFKFSDDLDLEGNELKNFRIDNLASAPNCDGIAIGRAYHNTTDNNTYVCNGTAWEQVNGGGSGVSDTLAGVQARRTSNFTLTNQNQWYDIPFDTTDIENDATVLEHNNSNTERIDIKADGLYRLTYHLDASDNTVSHGIQAKLRLNNTSDVPGTFLESTNYQTEHSPLTATVLAELNNGDYITLQAQRLSSNTVIGEPLITAVKLDGVKGDKGDPGSVGTGTDADSWTLDENNDGIDLDLIFGETLGEYLQWNNTAQAFILSDDLLLNFNELKQFKIENSATPLTCNSSYAGRVYHNTADTNTYVCDGASWVKLNNTTVIGQFWDSAGGLDINVATPVAIPFNQETRKDSGITHNNVTNNTRIYMDDPGWYEITYNINGEDTNSRINPKCRIRLNGTTFNDQSTSYSYTRNTTDKWGTNNATTLIQTTTSNEYYEILCNQEGSFGTYNTVANQSWTYIEKK